ncbi:DUF6444 domain-containing protein [Streptomyces sp. NPDC000880]
MESRGEPTREELLLLLSAKDATIAALTALVEQQAVQVAGLVARVAEPERQLGKDSSNSSKPPSSDAPFAKPAPKQSSRMRSGRGPGKQDGTAGTTLKRVEDPDTRPSSRTRRHVAGAVTPWQVPSLRRAPSPGLRRPASAATSEGDRVPDRVADLYRLRHHHGG